MKFLVVDDDLTSQIVFKKILERAGHEAVCAGDGLEALAMLREGMFDAVLMDIKMPMMDGLQATHAIRAGKAGQDKTNIPIIALTAYAMPGDREKFIAAGMNHYLAKPVGELEFSMAIIRAKQLVALFHPA